MINVIRRLWLPRALPELAVWFSNFAKQFSLIFTSLGFSAAENTSVQNDNETIQWLNDAAAVNEAVAAAMRSFRDQTLYGAKNDDPPSLPSTALPTPPPTLTSSIIARLDNLKERIELADGYTEDMGKLLGIVPIKSDSSAETESAPTLEAFEAAEGYEFAAVVKNRGKADMNELQYRLPNQEKWQVLKTFTGKSCNAKYVPEQEGLPIKLEIRVQCYRNNEKYGPPSNPVYVRLNP